MTLKEQHHKAACDRNLKQSYHGLIISDYTIRHDDLKNRYKAIITVQTPYYDISPTDFLNWVLKTFPAFHLYLKDTTYRSFFFLNTEPVDIQVLTFGRNRFKNSDLIEMQIGVTDLSNRYIGNWSREIIQKFVDNAASCD